MAIKELKKAVKNAPIRQEKVVEKEVSEFISKGGNIANSSSMDYLEDHRLTLRIPKSLMNKIDERRKERVGKISRNLWILELIEKATRQKGL